MTNKLIKTIRMCSSISSVYIGNLARGSSSMLGSYPLLRYQISRNGVGYLETQMNDDQIKFFMETTNKIPTEKYYVINKQLNSYQMYIGKYDHIDLRPWMDGES